MQQQQLPRITRVTLPANTIVVIAHPLTQTHIQAHIYAWAICDITVFLHCAQWFVLMIYWVCSTLCALQFLVFSFFSLFPQLPPKSIRTVMTVANCWVAHSAQWLFTFVIFYWVPTFGLLIYVIVFCWFCFCVIWWLISFVWNEQSTKRN